MICNWVTDSSPDFEDSELSQSDTDGSALRLAKVVRESGLLEEEDYR